MELPEALQQGEIARLIPVISDTRKEQRAVSVFLATVSAVPDLANSFLGLFGQRFGKRSSLNSYTEVKLSTGESKGTCRPDGYLELVNGKHTWSALVEAKIGTAPLKQEQVERYLSLARDNNIDAVITISNDFATRPDHHPLSISKVLTRRVSLFHVSWMTILTEAILLQKNAAINDPDQAFLLRELIRFLSHESAGVKRYDHMPEQWPKIVEVLQNNGTLKKSDPSVEAVVSGWNQEIRDLSLMLSRSLGVNTTVKLSRAHQNDANLHLRSSIEHFCQTDDLIAELSIPNAATELEIVADLKTRTTIASMRVDTPKDKKSNTAKVNWVLRQIKDADAEGLWVRIIWSSRAPDKIYPLADLRQDVGILKDMSKSSEVRAVELFAKSASSRRFRGRKTFIEDLESLVPNFYERVGQHLENWKPKPPALNSGTGEEPKSNVADAPSQTMAGNDHTALLEIPPFLKRLSFTVPTN